LDDPNIEGSSLFVLTLNVDAQVCNDDMMMMRTIMIRMVMIRLMMIAMMMIMMMMMMFG
jgi:hypothetical protein